ncbi:MAG: response regulator, partial [Gemmatimonadales bacterium]
SLLGVTGGELAVYEEDAEELVVVASHNIGEDSVGNRMNIGEGAMGHVARTHEPLIIPNYQEWDGRSDQYTQSIVQSVMVVPLLIGHRLVGAIAAVHQDPSRKFGEADLRLLNLFAAQAAIAIENARLFTAERRRADEQRALLETMKDLSSDLDLSSVLNGVLERAVALLGATGGELAVFDEHGEHLKVVASLNLGTDSTGASIELGEGAMGRVAQTHEPPIIPNYQAWEGRSHQYERDGVVQAVMAAPLLVRDRFVGGIAAVHSDPSHVFREEDLRLLELFGPQAAIAIENARLFTAERVRADEQRALLETMKDLSGELELSKVLQGVLERAVGLLAVTGGELATFDEARNDLVIAASFNMENNAVGTRMKIGEGAMGQVAETGETLIIPDYQGWEGRSAKYTQSVVQSVIAQPLHMGSRLVGVIAAVHSESSRVFGPEDIRRLGMFASQAAIAVENARLYSAAQRYFEDLVLNNPIAIANLDLEFNVLSCNPAFQKLFGYTEEEAVSRNLDDLVTTDQEAAEAHAYTERTMAGEIISGTGKRRRKDGALVDVELYSIPVMVGDECVGMMALYHDITELLAARKEAEEASHSKSQFLANMSHELRTPLNAIIGYSEMLVEDTAEAGHVMYVPDLAKIETAGKHLLALINEILDLSKIEAGKMELYLEPVEVKQVVEEVVATIHPLAEKNRNQLKVSLGTDLGEMVTDVVKTRQILLNLLANACKFTEAGTVGLAVRRDPSVTDDPDMIIFEVSDSGIGMTPEQLDRLFEAFSQADASTTRKFGGTGLGLVISRRFARMMGGDIEVESTPGSGSLFRTILPARASESSAAHGVASPSLNLALRAGVGPGTAGTVLVIDDDPEVHELLRRSLTREGYRVEGAPDGLSGLVLGRELTPDCIILDVRMPGLDGWGVLAALKADDALSHIPVIILSMLDDRNLGFALGAAEYLTKPVNNDVLLRTLERFTSSREAPLLIVDDDPGMRELLSRALEKDGWSVMEAANGRAALEMLEANSQAMPQLIFLDLMMPEMDGFETAARLRANAEWSDIPVVVLTALDLTDEHRQRLAGSVDLVVSKGGHALEDLLPDVRKLLHAHSRIS